jgi:anti-anti-sigma factor
MPDLCTIETRQTDRYTIVRLIGEVDASNATSIDQELRAIELAARNTFVVDLNALEYIDSAGIAALEHLTRETNCKIVIAEDATVYNTLHIVQFNAGNPLYESLSDALSGAT